MDAAEGNSDDRPERLPIGDKASEREEGEEEAGAHVLGRQASLSLISKAVADDG